MPPGPPTPPGLPAPATRAIGPDTRFAAHAGPVVPVRPPRLHVVADINAVADVDVAVVNAPCTPAGIAGPGRRKNRTGSPVPVGVVPQRADRDPGAETEEWSDERGCRLIDRDRVIGWDIDRRGIGRLDGDDILPTIRACDHCLLGRGLECARFIRFRPKLLDHVGDVLRLVHLGVAEIGGPVEILAHLLHHGRKARESLHRRIPVLTVDPGEVVARDLVRVLVEPALRLDNLHGVCARWQHLRQQRIGIERDRGEQLSELIPSE